MKTEKYSIQQISEKIRLPTEYADLILPSAYTYLESWNFQGAPHSGERPFFTESLLQQKRVFLKTSISAEKSGNLRCALGEIPF